MNSQFNPLDEAHISFSLQEVLNQEFAAPIKIVGAPKRITAATSAWVWFIELSGDGLPIEMQGPLVLRISEPKERNLQESQIELSKALVDRGFPAPKSHWHGNLGGYPAELQQRLPGRQAITLLGTYKARKTLRELGKLQAKLHSLPTQEFKLQYLDALNFLSQDIDLRRARVNRIENSGIWEWLHQNAPKVLMSRDEFPVLCHGDFHPLNAIVAEDGNIGIVDWTDARLSDRHNDVGRTIATYWFGALVAETRVQRIALKFLRSWMRSTHRSSYEKFASQKLNENRLNWWQIAHLYRFWFLLAELTNGTVADRDSSTTSRLPGDLMDLIILRCLKLQRI